MENTLTVIVGIVFGLPLSGVISALVAQTKNRSVVEGFLLGLSSALSAS